MQPSHRVPRGLLVAYLVIWAALAWSPEDRVLWAVENLLILIGLPVVVLTGRWFRFSDRSYVAMFLFLVLHAVGAHYGYTQVPLDWEDWGFGRNHSDRVAHFCFGLLAVFPVEELLRRLAGLKRPWLGPLTVTATFALAAFFEVIEWLAIVVGGEAIGPREGGYLGTQGDQFDAVKDMALGLAGAIVTMSVLALPKFRTPRTDER
jgi:putative membrane protein